MWIDTRTNDLIVYETNPGDVFVKKMTWVPERNGWVLFHAPPSQAELLLQFAQNKDQLEAAKDWNAGNLDYAEMRIRMG
jgi:hypothetical protein